MKEVSKSRVVHDDEEQKEVAYEGHNQVDDEMVDDEEDISPEIIGR